MSSESRSSDPPSTASMAATSATAQTTPQPVSAARPLPRPVTTRVSSGPATMSPPPHRPAAAAAVAAAIPHLPVIQIKELGPKPVLEVVTATIEPQPTSIASGTESEKPTIAHAVVPSCGTATPRKFLRATDPARQYLPGQPRIQLNPESSLIPGGGDVHQNELLGYLRRAHLTDELDGLLPFMKYIFVQTPSHKHIMALHHQSAHGREIIVNEHPGLHLVWYYERIFIKPIPSYLLSQPFWVYLRDADPAAYSAALGFMRSWYYLIQYELDYRLAVDLHLIPSVPGTASPPSYEEWCDFARPFRGVLDEEVSRRFRFGELRLTRINKTTMLFRGKLAYFHIHPQWGSYLSHIIAPVVTVFAILSVILNAQQVALAAYDTGIGSGGGGGSGGDANGAGGVEDPSLATQNWQPLVMVSLYFPIAIMVAIALILTAAVLGVLVKGFKDLLWTKSVRHRRKRGEMGVGEKSYGLIW